MRADKRKQIIDEITRRNPKHGLTFTSLSGKQLKRALAVARARRTPSPYDLSVPGAGLSGLAQKS